MSRIESARKSFRISNAWLDAGSGSCDLTEIVRNNSEYLDWVVAHDGENRDEIRQQAMLDPTAIATYDTIGGDNIYGRIAEDNVTRKRQLIGKIVHPLAFKRVRANGTQCRDIEILGFGQSNPALQ